MTHLFKSGRTGRYYCQFTLNGKRRQFSTKTSNKQDAIKIADQKTTEFKKQVGIFEPTSITLQEFSDYYLRTVSSQLSKGSVLAYKDSLKHFIQSVGNLRFTLVTIPICQKFIYHSGYSPQTASKHYRHLKRAFRLAVRWRYTGFSPFEHIDPPRVPETKKDYLTETEFSHLMDCLRISTFAERRFKRLIYCARMTGARESEILNLSMQNIDFERSNLYLKNNEIFKTKSRKDRTVPLSSELIQILKEQIRENRFSDKDLIRQSPYIFPSNNGTPLSIYYVSPQFKKVCRELFPYKKRLCFHSLRSTFITLAIFDGVPRTQIQRAVGHRSYRTTESYAHLETIPMDDLRASLNKSNT